jgi:sulfofructose kinase
LGGDFRSSEAGVEFRGLVFSVPHAFVSFTNTPDMIAPNKKVPRMIALGAICTTTIYRVSEILPAPAKVLAQDMIQVVDGMAISAACAFQKLGGQAQVWARLGDDALGLTAREALRAEGLNVAGLRCLPGARSSLATVIVDGEGERLVVPFHDPTIDVSADWLPLADLDHCDILHCDVRWPDGAEVAMRSALARGVATMLDGEVAPPDVLSRLLPLATYAVFSDAGLQTYTGLKNIEAGLRLVAATRHLLPPALALRRHIGASCGAQGYFWLEDGQLCHAPAPKVKVIDTLAAGDVFHGALALALVEGRPVAEAAHFACIAASLKCTLFGGRLGCPDRAEVWALAHPLHI